MLSTVSRKHNKLQEVVNSEMYRKWLMAASEDVTGSVLGCVMQLDRLLHGYRPVLWVLGMIYEFMCPTEWKAYFDKLYLSVLMGLFCGTEIENSVELNMGQEW